MDGGSAAVEVEVLPVEAEEFALAESGAHSEFIQGVKPVSSAAVEGWKRLGQDVVVLTCRATLRGSSSSRTACSRADLRTAWTYVTVSGESRFPQR